ncbi:hypothetical protein [Sphingomonas sp. IC081]|uniref:hypothetical protein n=1 Tax=Sphingomonas sp. IC081 TaxID=304378 RepID=UPI00115C2041|nr:hypothetical protein [Sphingomonas sp. IC081]QDK34766.1 DUF2971 domain-containing protein [Sphingomonas sp. IC081]
MSFETDSDKTKTTLGEAAAKQEAEFYHEKIGRSFPMPYLIDGSGAASVFSNEEIAAPEGACEECREPLKSKGKRCAWCAIDDVQRTNAANNNPLRMLDSYGLLDEYMASFPRGPRVPYK